METVSVVDYVEKNSIISEQQHGFVHGHSWLASLLEVMEARTMWLDSRHYTVPHKRLLNKKMSYGIGGHGTEWIQSFLSFVVHIKIKKNQSIET